MVASVEMAQVLQAGAERSLKSMRATSRGYLPLTLTMVRWLKSVHSPVTSIFSFGLVSMLRALGSMLALSVDDVFQVLQGNGHLMISSTDHFPYPAEADGFADPWRRIELKLYSDPNADG